MFLSHLKKSLNTIGMLILFKQQLHSSKQQHEFLASQKCIQTSLKKLQHIHKK